MEVAVDLEHHSYRSFVGFVCLMQISTRSQDWIIDCLDPAIRVELETLNEVFANPSIVKVRIIVCLLDYHRTIRLGVSWCRE